MEKCLHLDAPESLIAQLYGAVVKPRFACKLKGQDHSALTQINNAYFNETGIKVGSSSSCFYHMNKSVGCSKCPRFDKLT